MVLSAVTFVKFEELEEFLTSIESLLHNLLKPLLHDQILSNSTVEFDKVWPC